MKNYFVVCEVKDQYGDRVQAPEYFKAKAEEEQLLRLMPEWVRKQIHFTKRDEIRTSRHEDGSLWCVGERKDGMHVVLTAYPHKALKDFETAILSSDS